MSRLTEKDAQIEWLKSEMLIKVSRLRSCLQGLLDVQNGPPLIQEKDIWYQAVDNAMRALREIKP